MIKNQTYAKLFLSACLNISIVGCGGGSSSSGSANNPPSATENVTAVNALVQSSNGSLLKGVTVTILGQKTTTNENGLAQFNVNVPKSTQEVVVQYEAQGFVTQSILVKVSELSNITANLLAAKEIVPVDDIAIGQVIKAESLGATITIPADAFTDVKGRLVQGKVNVEFTPWDITSNDLNAMPANGFALDAQGNRTQLISAGMITATFKDAATGEKLQLASGKTADIQMDLPLKSINNQEMKIGTEIPMWHFDEAKGLWVEEGKGQVVASTTSVSGLAVHATVSHFSTWNWDSLLPTLGSVFIQCQSEGKPLPCVVNATVYLDNQWIYTRGASIISDMGTTVYNMPRNQSITKIEWKAKDLTGKLIGEQVSTASDNVVINISKPVIDNFVQCILPDGQNIPCTGKLNNSYQFSATAEGARVMTNLQDNDGQIDWSATSQPLNENGQWVYYTGQVVSHAYNTNKVTILLNNRELIGQSKGINLPVVCTSQNRYTLEQKQEYGLDEWEELPYLVGKECIFEIMIEDPDWDPESNDSLYKIHTFKAVYGQPIIITLPIEDFNPELDDQGKLKYIYLDSSIGFPYRTEHGRVFLDYHSNAGKIVINDNKLIPIIMLGL